MGDSNQLPVELNKSGYSSGPGSVVVYDGIYERPDQDEDIDLRAIWRTIFRHRKVAGLIFISVLSITLIGTLLMRPVYTASVLMEINTGGRTLVKFQNVEEQDLASREYMRTQSRILSSEAVAAEVIERLGLTEEPEFTGELSQRGLLNGVRSIISLLTPAKEMSAESIKQDAVERYIERLVVGQIRSSSLVNVSFSSFDPELAAKVVNEHANAYVWLSNERRFSSTSGAKAFLKKEISNVQAKLESSEKRLTEFAREYGVIDVEDRNNIMMERLSELNQSLSEVQNQRIDAETQFIQSQSADAQQLPIVYNDELIKTLREEQAALQSEYLELSNIYKPRYPKMQQLKAKINELEANITMQAEKIVAGLAANYDQLALREERLGEELQSQKEELLDLQDRAVTYNILKREWEANRELYSGLLERTKEVGVAAGMELNVGSLLDDASVPDEPSSPNLLINLMLAGVVGLGLGLGVTFLLAMLDNTISDTGQLQQVTGLGLLGAAPVISDNIEDDKDGAAYAKRIATLVNVQPDSAFSESIQSVRTSLSYARAGGFPATIMLTSAVASEGKSTVALNLAISCANSGKKVVVVEADLRKPRHHNVFGVPNAPGLADCLVQGGAPHIYHSQQSNNLDFIVAGTQSPNPVDLLGSNALRGLVNDLSEQYDLVLLDCPPILGLADSILLSTVVEGVLFVVAAHDTPREAVKNAIQRLRTVNAPLVGTVLNKVLSKSAGYYYDDYNYSYLSTSEKKSA